MDIRVSVYAYYEIGRKIVEEEQNGENRAAYGRQLLKELSKFLTKNYGKGYSAENLKLMRRFYMVYSQEQIGGWSNQKIVPKLNDQLILEHLRKIQRKNQFVGGG